MHLHRFLLIFFLPLKNAYISIIVVSESGLSYKVLMKDQHGAYQRSVCKLISQNRIKHISYSSDQKTHNPNVNSIDKKLIRENWIQLFNIMQDLRHVLGLILQYTSEDNFCIMQKLIFIALLNQVRQIISLFFLYHQVRQF